MNAITQAIVNQSTLDITHIKITNATKDSFTMSMESRVANTGPVGATMSPMTVDMCGTAGCFGRLDLPEIKTSSSGTTVKVTDQLIKIVDMEAFKAFNKSIMSEESLVLRLDNGQATIKAMFMSAKIIYKKEVTLKGMNGPKTKITTTSPTESGFKNTQISINPSPLEIDLGTLKQEIRNAKGEKIAEQQGEVYFMRGENSYQMTGTVTGGKAEGEMKVVGLGVVEDNWHNETITSFIVPVEVTNEFAALCNGTVSS